MKLIGLLSLGHTEYFILKFLNPPNTEGGWTHVLISIGSIAVHLSEIGNYGFNTFPMLMGADLQFNRDTGCVNIQPTDPKK